MTIARSFILIAAACLIVGGCARAPWRRVQGDAGQFLLNHALRLGARPINTNDLPRLGTKWKYLDGSNVVDVALPGRELSQADSFLRQCFGAPSKALPEQTVGSGRYGEYSGESSGVTIHFGRGSYCCSSCYITLRQWPLPTNHFDPNR